MNLDIILFSVFYWGFFGFIDIVLIYFLYAIVKDFCSEFYNMIAYILFYFLGVVFVAVTLITLTSMLIKLYLDGLAKL